MRNKGKRVKRDRQNPISERRDHCPKVIISQAAAKKCNNMENFDILFAAMPTMAKIVYVLGVIALAGITGGGALAWIYFCDGRIF